MSREAHVQFWDGLAVRSPAGLLNYRKFGITAEAVVQAAREVLEALGKPAAGR
ncbi:MAG: hypothetical protein VB138_09985 [Burkholderia sp.]